MTGIPQIVITYDCHGSCGTVEREVVVPERLDGIDVLIWVRGVQILVSQDHRDFCPGCTSDKFDLKVPVLPNVGVGKVVRQ